MRAEQPNAGWKYQQGSSVSTKDRGHAQQEATAKGTPSWAESGRDSLRGTSSQPETEHYTSMSTSWRESGDHDSTHPAAQEATKYVPMHTLESVESLMLVSMDDNDPYSLANTLMRQFPHTHTHHCHVPPSLPYASLVCSRKCSSILVMHEIVAAGYICAR
jgi:hypothetical protein